MIAYRVLKNANCIPPEMELKKEILSLRDLIMFLDDEKERLATTMDAVQKTVDECDAQMG